MSERASRHSRPVPAGTPLPRRQALSLGVLALGCLFDPLRPQLAAAESQKDKDRDKKDTDRDEVPADLRAYVERTIPGAGQSAVVYADGVAVWNRERQLRIGREDVASVVRLFREAGFDAMPEPGFGGGKKRLARRAVLRRGGRTKEVDQLISGEQSAELKKLVDGVFDLLEPKAGAGVTAASLSEGLRKVGSAELGPQCLSLVAFRRPEQGRPGPGDGWMLHLDEMTATASSFSRGAFVDPRALPLDRARLTRLTEALAAAQPESLPGNLYAPDYRELTVQVLNHRKNVSARRFAGMTPTQHGDKQLAFDKAFGEVEALVKETRARGRKLPPTPPARPSNQPEEE